MTEGRHFVLTGRAHALVAPRIDGRRTTDELVDDLAGELTPTEVYVSVLTLEKHGHIVDADGEPATAPFTDPGALAFWEASGIAPRTVAERLAASPVSVEALGGTDAAALRSMLVASGAVLAEDAGAATLRIVLTDDALRPELADRNARALADDRPWLLVRPTGLFPWIGPLFVPGTTGCWACLAQRLEANQEVETFLAGLPDAAPADRVFPALAAFPPVVDAVIRLAGLEAVRHLVTGVSNVAGRIVTLDTLSLATQQHTLVRRPQCAACGDPRLLADRPVEVELVARPKTHLEDGGHRAASPRQMLDRYEHHISPLTGVAKTLVRITDPQDPVQHVYIAGSNMAARHDSVQRLRKHLRANACGKGTTDEQARASGLGEAIERYSGVFRGDEPRIRGSLRSLGERAIDPREVMRYSDAQYRERESWNAHDRRLDAIPMPFDPDAEIEWTPLWSLTRGEVRYLPTSFCYYSYPGPADQFYCLPESNGSAAGTSLEDAILQGFMELVERDAVAIWWYNRLRRPAVDLDRVPDRYVQDLRAIHARQGRDLWVLDLTHDLGIPAMVALSRRTDAPPGRGEEIVFAPAAHFDPALCLRRALTEINQMMPGLAPGPDGAEYAYDDPEAIAWWRTVTLADQPWLGPSDAPRTDLATVPRRWSDDLRTDVLTCRSIVEERGLEMLVLDQTRPDIGLPVVKVVVPGLRHFWARFGPGRLYDVPVAMGWLTEPTPEDRLNPIPIFI